MKIFKKKYFIWISLILSSFAFIFPFFISQSSDSLSSILSLSLSAVGAIATVLTLLIAIFLFDRFGLEGKFIEKQTEKVLELADALKGRTIVAKSNGFNYFIRHSRNQLELLNSLPFYKIDCKKIVLISADDYYISTDKILAVSRSYWMPDVIKEKVKFFELYAFLGVENALDKKYIRLQLGIHSYENWMRTLPEITLESFIINLSNLVEVVENWLKEHSGIPIDLKLEEAN